MGSQDFSPGKTFTVQNLCQEKVMFMFFSSFCVKLWSAYISIVHFQFILVFL